MKKDNDIAKTTCSAIQKALHFHENDKIKYTLENPIDSSPIKKIFVTKNGNPVCIVKSIDTKDHHHAEKLRAEFGFLQKVSPLQTAPQPLALLDEDSQLLLITEWQKQHQPATRRQSIDVARAIKKIHEQNIFAKPGNCIPPNYNLPYECPLYDTWLNDPDHNPLSHPELHGVPEILPEYNRIKAIVKQWFVEQSCFNECLSFHICYNNLKLQQIQQSPTGIIFTNWEHALVDIPELDLATYIVYHELNTMEQEAFLTEYYQHKRDEEIMERLDVLIQLISFIKIIDDAAISRIVEWSPQQFILAMQKYEQEYF